MNCHASKNEKNSSADRGHPLRVELQAILSTHPTQTMPSTESIAPARQVRSFFSLVYPHFLGGRQIDDGERDWLSKEHLGLDARYTEWSSDACFISVKIDESQEKVLGKPKSGTIIIHFNYHEISSGCRKEIEKWTEPGYWTSTPAVPFAPRNSHTPPFREGRCWALANSAYPLGGDRSSNHRTLESFFHTPHDKKIGRVIVLFHAIQNWIGSVSVFARETWHSKSIPDPCSTLPCSLWLATWCSCWTGLSRWGSHPPPKEAPTTACCKGSFCSWSWPYRWRCRSPPGGTWGQEALLDNTFKWVKANYSQI